MPSLLPGRYKHLPVGLKNVYRRSFASCSFGPAGCRHWPLDNSLLVIQLALPCSGVDGGAGAPSVHAGTVGGPHRSVKPTRLWRVPAGNGA
jgi:hypothetical protein